MENFVYILACLSLGKAFSFLERFPHTTPKTLNALVIWVSLPALVLVQMPLLLQNTPIQASLLFPLSMAWILFLFSFLFFAWLGKKCGWTRTRIGALTLCAGLGNTSFVGFPLLQALHGEEAVRIGVLVDQPGTFLVLSTLGLITASFYRGKASGSRLSSTLKNIFTFPPFLSLLVATLWYYSGTYQPGVILSTLEKFSRTLIPLALISVGFQLKLSSAVFRKQWKPLGIGLGFKMLLAPLFFLGLFQYVLGSHEFSTHITILEAAMAPMVTATVVAEDFGLDAELASLMLGLGICLSLATVPLWNFVLGY